MVSKLWVLLQSCSVCTDTSHFNRGTKNFLSIPKFQEKTPSLSGDIKIFCPGREWYTLIYPLYEWIVKEDFFFYASPRVTPAAFLNISPFLRTAILSNNYFKEDLLMTASGLITKRSDIHVKRVECCIYNFESTSRETNCLYLFLHLPWNVSHTDIHGHYQFVLQT